MPADLEYMLGDDIDQPHWVPRAYGDVLRTFQTSSNEEPPVRLLIYHSNGQGNTVVYQFLLLEYFNGLAKEQGELEMGSYSKSRLLVGETEGEPWEEKAKTTLWNKCLEDKFDAIHMDIAREPDEDLIAHISAFAAMYFIHEFYDSVPGVEKADERIRAAPEGTIKLPTQPYDGEPAQAYDTTPRKQPEYLPDNVIPFPAKRFLADDE